MNILNEHLEPTFQVTAFKVFFGTIVVVALVDPTSFHLAGDRLQRRWSSIDRRAARLTEARAQGADRRLQVAEFGI